MVEPPRRPEHRFFENLANTTQHDAQKSEKTTQTYAKAGGIAELYANLK
jgi:hypothetical protein